MGIAILDIDGTLVDTNYHHTIAWYRANAAWVDAIKNKDYLSYYEKQYGSGQ